MAAPLLIGHRGASAEAPENTLAAFARALARGVDGIELDVQLTRDGVPVVFHDATLTRLTGRPGRIAAQPARSLRALRIRGEPIPTLAEVLALTRGRAVVQVELKRGVAVAPVVRAVRRSGAADGILFASFQRSQVAAAAALAPEVPRMLIHPGWPAAAGSVAAGARALVPVLARLGASGVSLDWRGLRTAAAVRTLHRHGFSVWCWTVNAPGVMLRLSAWGVDGLLSDDPALLRAVLRRPAG